MNIKGLQELISHVLTTGVKPQSVGIIAGSVSMRHGMWLVTNRDVGVVHEGYGLATLIDMLVDTPQVLMDTSNKVKYLKLGEDQEQVTEFDVVYSEEDMIKMKTVLATGVGERQVCGEGCNQEGHNHEQEDVHTEDNGESGSGDIESGNTEGDVGTEEESGTEENSEESESTGETTESDTLTEVNESQLAVPETNTSPDFEHAESLYNLEDKSGSKVKLEEYAREFDVELSRGKTFENMMIDFKETFNGE